MKLGILAITEFEFLFDEIPFSTNETDLRNMNCEITKMQMNSKEIQVNFIIFYSFNYCGICLTAFCIIG